MRPKVFDSSRLCHASFKMICVMRVLFLGLSSAFMLIIFSMSSLEAKERQTDPDGCLICHALEGLQYVDKKGVLRVASIDKADYFSSLHGSVPCTDCHRVKTYPHDVKEALADCAGNCHVEEPSKGEAFTHKAVVKEFQKSTHGQGRVKDFGGGDRLDEEAEQNPSCRRCHSNTAYIPEHQMAKFKSEFEHTNTECGKCHLGETWMNQFSGHILRRLVGSRWNKQDINQSCTQCHADLKRMAKVKLEDSDTKQKNPASFRWQHSVESYERTLHSRLLEVGEEKGASCLDCHIQRGEGLHGHGILKDEHKLASTHPDQLGKTCGAVGCHEYAKSALNSGFVKTDMHALDQVAIPDVRALFDPNNWHRSWFWGGLISLVLALLMLLGSGFWLLFIYPKAKKSADPLLGSERFEQVMLGRKPKKAPVKATAAKTNVSQKTADAPLPSIEPAIEVNKANLAPTEPLPTSSGERADE